MKKLSGEKDEKASSCLNLVPAKEKPDCPHCHASAATGWIVKHGRDKGVRRFLCKKCNHHFVPTTNTVFARTKKSADIWKKFISLTIAGKSLHACCAECNIAYQTAFTWRHKVLNAFVVNQDTMKLSGYIEADEFLISLSYKGNHIKGGFAGRK